MKVINIVGAGAAGLFLGMLLSRHKVEINYFDLGKAPGRKILISGGGACNFTNLEVEASNYLSQNPNFVISALKGFTNYDFISWFAQTGLEARVKDDSKLYVEQGAKALVQQMLEFINSNAVYSQAKITWHWQQEIVNFAAEVNCSKIYNQREQEFTADFTILATGGLAMPRLKVTEWLATTNPMLLEQHYVATRPGLVPLLFTQETSFYGKARLKGSQEAQTMSGISLKVRVSNQSQEQSFCEQMLFTHQGFSGPAILQISNYWQPGEYLYFDFLPDLDLAEVIPVIVHKKKSNLFISTPDSNKQNSYNNTASDVNNQSLDLAAVLANVSPTSKLKTLLALCLPNRLVEVWDKLEQIDSTLSKKIVKQFQPLLNKQLAQLSKEDLKFITEFIHQQPVLAQKDQGYDKAEVMLGGLNTKHVSSKTMQLAKTNVFVIGECLDVTGQLGGYNFQWCWSSAFACYKEICKQLGEKPQPLV